MSHREAQILKLIQQGMYASEIAGELYYSTETVRRIIRKSSFLRDIYYSHYEMRRARRKSLRRHSKAPSRNAEYGGYTVAELLKFVTKYHLSLRQLSAFCHLSRTRLHQILSPFVEYQEYQKSRPYRLVRCQPQHHQTKP